MAREPLGRKGPVRTLDGQMRPRMSFPLRGLSLGIRDPEGRAAQVGCRLHCVNAEFGVSTAWTELLGPF